MRSQALETLQSELEGVRKEQRWFDVLEMAVERGADIETGSQLATQLIQEDSDQNGGDEEMGAGGMSVSKGEEEESSVARLAFDGTSGDSIASEGELPPLPATDSKVAVALLGANGAGPAAVREHSGDG